MRTIWDVSAQRDNEETEAGRGVGHNQLASDTWDPDTFGTQAQPGKKAINRGQMGDTRTASHKHRERGSPNPAPGFSEVATISCLPFVATIMVAFLLLPKE